MLGGKVNEKPTPGAAGPPGVGAPAPHKGPTKAMAVTEFLNKGVGAAQLPRCVGVWGRGVAADMACKPRVRLG